jgi:hypothetical protein
MITIRSKVWGNASAAEWAPPPSFTRRREGREDAKGLLLRMRQSPSFNTFEGRRFAARGLGLFAIFASSREPDRRPNKSGVRERCGQEE